MARAAHEDLDERLLHRLLFFTDAVFAIVMTLLVLELRPPEGNTFEAQLAGLWHMTGRLSAFALSFSIIAIFWVAHLSTTRRLKAFDWATTIANLFFLFPICLLPFVSAWVGEAVGTRASWSAYCVVQIAISTANIVLVLVQTRDGGRLIEGGMTPRGRLYRAARAASPGIAFAIGLVGASFHQVYMAQFCWVLIPVVLRTSRLLAPKED